MYIKLNDLNNEGKEKVLNTLKEMGISYEYSNLHSKMFYNSEALFRLNAYLNYMNKHRYSSDIIEKLYSDNNISELRDAISEAFLDRENDILNYEVMDDIVNKNVKECIANISDNI